MPRGSRHLEAGQGRSDSRMSGLAVTGSPERVVQANGVELCLQTFGDAADPVILLIHGATTSMLGWDERLCRILAAAGRYVIRYDQRDTGRSVSYPPGEPGYTLPDLADDAIALLDALGLAQASVVGVSMGGGVAMAAALRHPDRVASLTLIGTTPGGSDLPPMSQEFLAFVAGSQPPDWNDQDAVVEHVMRFLRVLSGGDGRLHEAAIRPFIAEDVARTRDIAASQTNHYRMAGGEWSRARLSAIAVPTLVIHGDQDPIFPLAHGEALRDAIPGSQLIVLQRTGHLLLPDAWDTLVPALLRLSAG